MSKETCCRRRRRRRRRDKKMCLCDPQVVKEWILFRKRERDVSVEGGGDGGLHDGSRISFFSVSLRLHWLLALMEKKLASRRPCINVTRRVYR